MAHRPVLLLAVLLTVTRAAAPTLDAITNLEVMVGTGATLLCTFKDLPAELVSVSWSDGTTTWTSTSAATGYTVTNGNLVNKKQTISLVIGAAQNTGDKTFTCTASVYGVANSQGNHAVPLKTFTMVTSTAQEVKVGNTITLTCQISGLTVSSTAVKWGDESKEYSYAKRNDADNSGFTVGVGTDGQASRTTSLTIAGSHVTGDREYTCKVQVAGTWFEKTISSKTYEVAVGSGDEVKVGTAGQLDCTVIGVQGTPTFSWISGAVTITSSGSDAKYTLTTTTPGAGSKKSVLGIKAAGVTGDATWTCKVAVGSDDSSTTVNLYTFTLAPSSADVLNGQDVVLTCTASDLSASALSVKWTDGVTTWTPSSSTSSGYTVSEANLVSSGVRRTTLTVAGGLNGGDRWFTCMVNTGGSNWYPEAVQMKIFNIEMTPAETRNTTAATLTCKVRWASVAPSAITWSVEGDTAEYTRTTVSSKYTVTYNSASFDSTTGTVLSTMENKEPVEDKHYTCNVKYAARTFHAVTTLTVFGIHTQDEAVLPGQSATLTCLIDGDPDTAIEPGHVKWSSINDGKTYDIVSSGKAYDQAAGKLTLALSNIQFDQVYTCSVWADGKWHSRTQKVEVFSFDAIDDLNVEGDMAAPMCKINNMDHLANNVFSVSWSTNGAAITSGLVKSSGGYAGDTLNVKVGASDTLLTCTVSVALNFGVKQFTKTVKVDSVQISHPNVVQTQGAPASLRCTVTGVNREAEESTTSWSTAPYSSQAGSDYNAVLTQYNDNSHTFEAQIASVSKSKTEGKWACNFVYPRYTSPAMSRTINRVLYLDVSEWTTVPVVQYKAKDSTATYTCRGRHTGGVGIYPTYTWTVNGQDRTSESSVTNYISTLSIKAVYELDAKTVQCHAKWTSTPSSIHHSMTTSTLLYSKYIAVYPNSEVYAEVGGELKITCVVNTIYNSASDGNSLRWYKDNSINAINPNAINSNIAITNTTLSTAVDTESSVLTIKVVSNSDVGKYKCVWDYGAATAANRQATINFKNALDIVTQPTVNSPSVLSGYTTSYSVNAEKDAAFPQMTYVWYKNGEAVQTHTQTSSVATSTFNTGQVMYRTDKDNKYTVKVTWTGTYQTRSKISVQAAIDITDTCRVEYGTLNSQTKVNNNDAYVITGTKIVTTCDRGYILPKASNGAAMSYTQTCTTNTAIPVKDTDVNFINCIGGNLVNYQESSVSTISSNDAAKLTLSGGYWTVHKGTVATIACSAGYTLRKTWGATTTCNSASAGACRFDGLCIKGCEYSRNANTKTTYVTPHNVALVANGDQYKYYCEAHTFTTTGVMQYTATCNAAAGAMQLNQCNDVTFAAPNATLRVNTLLLQWNKPSYPSESPVKYTVTLSRANGYSWTKVTSGHAVSYNKLSASTTYNVTYVITYYHNKPSDVKRFTFTTAANNIATDLKNKELNMDVPVVDYRPKAYETLVIYMSDDYVGQRKNFVYKYTNWLHDKHRWSQHEEREEDHDSDHEDHEDHGRRRRAVGGIVKRDTVTQTIIWIYPSADDLFDSGVNIGAWIANSTAPEAVSGSRLTFDARKVYLKDDAQYYIFTRVCNPAKPMECVYGEPTILDVPYDWRIPVILGILIPIVIIIAIILIIILYKNNQKEDKRRSMEANRSYHNKAYKKDGE